MTDLAAWLLDAITEDEADAREASDERLWRWSQHGDMIIADSGHMQRFTPARVLAECAAKRAIVEAFASSLREAGERGYTAAAAEAAGLWHAMMILAQPYAGRPGYRDEWKP